MVRECRELDPRGGALVPIEGPEGSVRAKKAGEIPDKSATAGRSVEAVERPDQR